MFKTVPKILLGFALLTALQACASVPSAVPTLDPNAINTAIAQTMSVAATQTGEVGVPITGGESSTPTPVVLTAIPTATLSPTPAFTATSAFTPTSSITQVSVSVATNCRTGPGAGYPRVGGLQIDQVAEVVGRNSDSSYWIIQNPNRPGETCWLWGQFATLTGDAGALPVFTPPAPPPPTTAPTATRTLTPLPTSLSPTPTTPPPSPTPTPTATP